MRTSCRGLANRLSRPSKWPSKAPPACELQYPGHASRLHSEMEYIESGRQCCHLDEFSLFSSFFRAQAEDKMCKDFLNTIPLISLLGSKAMRPRHWLMLMKATGKSIPAVMGTDSHPGGIRQQPPQSALLADTNHFVAFRGTRRKAICSAV